MKKEFKPKYSGVLSECFWKRINSLKKSDQKQMYSLGVTLQNLEEFVLNLLNEKK